MLRFLFHADRLSYYYNHASHHCDREQRRRYRIQALMGENGLKGLDILTVASFLLGYENLMENRQQSAQNDVAAANDKQAEYLLRELSDRFEEQNAMLKEILEAVKK